MKKLIGYRIFAILYYIACLFVPVKKNRFFCVMTHDGSSTGSVGVVVAAIRNKIPDAEFVYVKKENRRGKGLIDLILNKPFKLASSCMILMDNEFLPLAYIKLRDGVKVVQLWHGTGTIKKFGHDVNEGKMLEIVEKADKRITHLIVNSDYTASLYCKVFGVDSDRVFVTGIPRTDILFNDLLVEENSKMFYNKYLELKNKRIILYAPTFRDNEVEKTKIMLDLDRWTEMIGDDTVLILRLHPFVSDKYDEEVLKKYNGRILNLSSYDNLNALLGVTDILITDYSSVIFEYIVFNRPIIFYAYDLSDFSDNGRGFYENYEDYVPGIIAQNTEDVIRALGFADTMKEKREEFLQHAYKYKDGKSTQRLINLLFGGTNETAC